MNTDTRTHIKPKPTSEAVKRICASFITIIHQHGGIPSGHLYAMVMDNMDLDTYQTIIAFLIEHRFVTMSNHFLMIHPDTKARLEAAQP